MNRLHCMKCGKRITDEEAAASRAWYGPKADLCSACANDLAVEARKGRAPRSFHQACFQYACEFSGTRDRERIDGQDIASATSVAIRQPAAEDEAQGRVQFYELTLFYLGGDWRQLLFDPQGRLIAEQLGDSGKPPQISRAREVF